MSGSFISTQTNSSGLVRKAGPLEVLTCLFHDLGIQSNVIVAAQYHHPSNALTPPKVYWALQKVIYDHPALSLIGTYQPSEKKRGNHRIWDTRLPSIQFKDCVEFLDDDFDSDTSLQDLYEKAHNQWFNTGDDSKPWWKLLVVKQCYAVFVFHHFIGDGLSGYAYHRSFLQGLNRICDLQQDIATTQTLFATPIVDGKSLHSPLEGFDDKLSWAHVIYNFLFWITIRFFIIQKYFLFSDAVVAKKYPTILKPFPKEQRTITKVRILRIDRSTLEKCLESCRKEKTSFTALLHSLILITLAVDIYPQAKIGFSRQAVNIRPLLRVNPGRDTFSNAVSAYYRSQNLQKYRKAIDTQQISSSDAGDKVIDKAVVWKLAREYKTAMNYSMWKSRTIVQDFITCKLLGEDVEEVGRFQGLGLYQNNSFLMSNIGVFQPKEDTTDGGWQVKQVGFSAAAIRATLGDFGIVFNISSVKEGDCIIAATYEKGVLKDEMVRKVLDLVLERMKVVS